MIDLTDMLCAIISVVVLVLAYKVFPFIKLKVGEAHWNNILFWVGIAVNAAEQIYKGHGRGEEKKQAVRDFLNKMGFDVDLEAVDAMIESEVKKLT